MSSDRYLWLKGVIPPVMQGGGVPETSVLADIRIITRGRGVLIVI